MAVIFDINGCISFLQLVQLIKPTLELHLHQETQDPERLLLVRATRVVITNVDRQFSYICLAFYRQDFSSVLEVYELWVIILDLLTALALKLPEVRFKTLAKFLI
jgi:hypothetical protein